MNGRRAGFVYLGNPRLSHGYFLLLASLRFHSWDSLSFLSPSEAVAIARFSSWEFARLWISAVARGRTLSRPRGEPETRQNKGQGGEIRISGDRFNWAGGIIRI